jgi:hypothetical protein
VVAAHSGFLGDCDLAEEATQETRARGSIYSGFGLRPFCVVAGRLLPPVSRHGDNGLKASPADALEGGFRGAERCVGRDLIAAPDRVATGNTDIA